MERCEWDLRLSKPKFDIKVYHGKCDLCGQETLVIHYNYSKEYGMALCTKCCPKKIDDGMTMRLGHIQVSLEDAFKNEAARRKWKH
jgi:hypothetical protein